MSGRLDGKVAIVTVGARGKREAEARRFVAKGARVVVADVLEEEERKITESLGESAIFERLDVRDEANRQRVVASTVERFGSLTTLIDNAGIVVFSAFEQTPLVAYLRVIQVNQVGTFPGMKAAIPALAESSYISVAARVVDGASTVGSRVHGMPGHA